jgi:ATP-binding cassette subfamily F protein uup
VKKHVGGYSDWVRQNRELASGEDAAATIPRDPAPTKPRPPIPKKLSYKLQRELDGLPDIIHQTEAEIAALHVEVSSPSFYKQDQTSVQSRLELLTSLQERLDASMLRWIELEGLQTSSAAENETGSGL